MLNIPETHLREGDRVYSIGSPRTYIGRVTKVLPTLFYCSTSSLNDTFQNPSRSSMAIN